MNETKLTYHGEVEIIIRSKTGKLLKKKKHNAGTAKLQEIFAKALVGKYNNTYIPSYVSLDKSLDSGQLITEPISGLVYSTSDPSHPYPHVKLTAFIPYIDSIGQANYLSLRSSDKSQLAYLSLTNSGITSLSQGQSMIVNWYLYVSLDTPVIQEEN